MKLTTSLLALLVALLFSMSATAASLGGTPTIGAQSMAGEADTVFLEEDRDEDEEDEYEEDEIQ